MKLIKETIKKYRQDGFISLLYGIKYHVIYIIVLPPILRFITIDRENAITASHDDILSWAYGEPEKFTIKSPLSAELPEEFQHWIGEYIYSENHVFELQNATLIGPYAIPQTSGGRIFLEPMGKMSILRTNVRRTFYEMGYFKSIWYFLKALLPGMDGGVEYDTAVNLVPRHGKNVDHCSYGHWIAEDLPRLRGIDKYYQETGKRPPLLIKSDPPSWMRETLQLLGYDSDDWIEWNQETAKVNRLVVPTLRYLNTDDYDPCPADKQWLRDKMIQQIDTDDDDQFSKYVILSRQNTNRRRIANFDEVIELLEPYGFESYSGADLTVEEQISLCANAEVIIGANGSNMINVLWATDATVIALFPPEWFGIDSFMAANERGLDYDFIVGEQLNSPSDREDFEEDIQVDINRLESVVEEVI